MFITTDILKKYNACKAGIAWFERTFPNGAELIDVIQHPKVSAETLHWGNAHLTTTEGERAAYRTKLKIDCGEYNYTIYESKDIKDSLYVTHSNNVENGGYIFHCEDVTNSNNVLNSKNIENSFQVYDSEFVYDSQRILKGRNVNNSKDIVYSDYIIDSHHIMYAAAVTNSAWITDLSFGLTKRITDSYFISRGENLDHCLFCYGISDKKYCLFNKEITPQEYELIKKQMFSVLKDWQPELVVNNEWTENTIPLDAPQIQRNIIKQFAKLPESFWRWVTTLPGYDPAVLYAITYQPSLLK